ncbi:MAG: hypothetical protein WCG06_05395, partial [Candidatus Omnitrophota bacterium]
TAQQWVDYAIRDLRERLHDLLIREINPLLPPKQSTVASEVFLFTGISVEVLIGESYDVYRQTINGLMRKTGQDSLDFAVAAQEMNVEPGAGMNQLRYASMRPAVARLLGEQIASQIAEEVLHQRRREAAALIDSIAQNALRKDLSAPLSARLFGIARENPALRAELAPVIILNAWREDNVNKSVFTPYLNYDVTDSLVTDFIRSLSESDVLAIEAKIPGIRDMIDTVRTATFNYKRPVLVVSKTPYYDDFLERVVRYYRERYAYVSTVEEWRERFQKSVRGQTFEDEEYAFLQQAYKETVAEKLPGVQLLQDGDIEYFKGQEAFPNPEYERVNAGLATLADWVFGYGDAAAQTIAFQYCMINNRRDQAYSAAEKVLRSRVPWDVQRRPMFDLLSKRATDYSIRDPKAVLVLLRSCDEIKMHNPVYSFDRLLATLTKRLLGRPELSPQEAGEARALCAGHLGVEPVVFERFADFMDGALCLASNGSSDQTQSAIDYLIRTIVTGQLDWLKSGQEGPGPMREFYDRYLASAPVMDKDGAYKAVVNILRSPGADMYLKQYLLETMVQRVWFEGNGDRQAVQAVLEALPGLGADFKNIPLEVFAKYWMTSLTERPAERGLEIHQAVSSCAPLLGVNEAVFERWVRFTQTV